MPICLFQQLRSRSGKILRAILHFGMIILIGFCAGSDLQAQKADKDLLRAEKLYRMQLYRAAIPYFEQTLQREYDGLSCARLADCFRRQADYLQAEHWYRQAVMSDGLPPEFFQQYADVLRANEKSELALEWYERYDRYAGNRQAHVPAFALAAQERGQEQLYQVALLEINSGFSEICPAVLGDQLVFASDRPGQRMRSNTVSNDQPYYDLFLASKESDGRFRRPARMRGAVNSAWSEAGFSYHPESGEIWFTRTSSGGSRRFRDGQGVVRTSLYQAQWNGSRITRIKRFRQLPRQSGAAHPSLTPEGNRLYFASNLEGGFGGMDIWYCDRLPDHSGWAPPVNAGYRINTAKDELFPFAASDTRLYFSSAGHPGLGGLDIFSTDFSGGSWESALHLPAPINSSRDDFGWYVNNNQGYFSSNRTGGKGGDDLYAFERSAVRIQIHTVHAQTGQPVSGVRVELITDGQQNRQQSTDARGTTTFDLPPGIPFYLLLSKGGFQNIQFSDTRNRDRIVLTMQPEEVPAQKMEEPGEQTIQPETTETIRFRIRVGVYRRPDLTALEALSEIAPLFSEEKSNNTRAFYIGPFYDAAQASEALRRVKEKQFRDAFVEEWPK